jgi:YHS domain-containing protein
VIEEEEWVEYVDEGSGKPYYHNSVTNVTRWDKPPGGYTVAEHP